MHRTLCLACSITMLATLVAGPALASRAALNARALPNTLALDPAVAFTYPGSVGAFDPQILMDRDLVLGLAGRSLRFGYMDDAGTHALVVASPRGWGALLGFRDRYDSREDFHESGGGTTTWETRDWERMFLVSLGAHRLTASGRSYEAALTGRLAQGEQGNEYRAYSAAGDLDRRGFIWKSGPGLGVGLRLRTVSASPGPLFEISGNYLDRQPEADFPLPANLIERDLSAAMGWRLSYPGLDDLVLGAKAAWSVIHDLRVSGYSTEASVRRSRERTFSANVFLSGERKVLPSIVVRAGATAWFSDVKNNQELATYGTSYELQDRDVSAYRRLDSPGIAVGAGWHRDPFVFDVQAASDLNLDYLVARWALTLKLR